MRESGKRKAESGKRKIRNETALRAARARDGFGVEEVEALTKVGGMKKSFVLWAALGMMSWTSAQEKAPAAAPKRPLPPEAAKPEPFLLLPEPREMRVGHSVVLGGAKHTIFTPVRRVEGKPGLEAYSKAEFAKLGISPDTFANKARAAADRILASLEPELVRDDAGRVRYAVYRGEDPIFACLLVAPSLGKVFENVFGKEIWVAAPDRNALFVFPPNPAIVDDFAGDLEERFESNAFAASEEVFIMRGDSGALNAVGRFTDR
jgi:hypothetical protein